MKGTQDPPVRFLLPGNLYFKTQKFQEINIYGYLVVTNLFAVESNIVYNDYISLFV